MAFLYLSPLQLTLPSLFDRTEKHASKSGGVAHRRAALGPQGMVWNVGWNEVLTISSTNS